MNYAYLKHEFSLIMKSKKNLMYVLFLTALIVSYCFILLPERETVDTFDAEKMRITLLEMEDLQDSREKQNATGFVMMTGMSAYAATDHQYTLYHSMLHAYEKEEFTRFLRFRYLDMSPYKYIEEKEMFADSPFPGKDRLHFTNQTLERYLSYLEGDLPISYELITQRTALQVFQELLLSPWMYLILFTAIYFACDVLVRDRNNRTILQGMPISWYRLINLKSLAVLLYTSVVFTGLLVLGLGLLTILNGFGFTDIQIPTTVEGVHSGDTQYEMMALGKFLLLTMAGLVLLIYLFTRLSFLGSLLFKNEWVVLLLTSLLLFSERLYFERDLREIKEIEISKFPQTYFEIGKVLTGEKNFLVNLTTITYAKGMILFALSILVVEIILWIMSKIIDKQKFYRTN